MVQEMNSVTDHRDIYNQAATLRAEVQAELIINAFMFIKDSVKSKVPAFGPLYSTANYKMCMKAMNKRSAAV